MGVNEVCSLNKTTIIINWHTAIVIFSAAHNMNNSILFTKIDLRCSIKIENYTINTKMINCRHFCLKENKIQKRYL